MAQAAHAEIAATRVHLLRPAAGATVMVGTRINGIGWVIGDDAVGAVGISLGPIPLSRARVNLSASELAMLIGHPPPDAANGFVFAVTVPDLPPGRVALRLSVQTARGQSEFAVMLTLTAAPGMAPAPPPTQLPAQPLRIRAMVETARIDQRGLLRVSGWAVGLAPVDSVIVFVGPRQVGQAQLGLPRDDVAVAWPVYPDAATAGFLLQQEAPDADLDQAELHVVVTQGGLRETFTVPLARPPRLQRRVREPLADLACEEVLLTQTGMLAVKGWAVASSGVAEISVELDDAVVGTARPDESRPDVGNRYPAIAGAAQAGFRLQCRLPGRFEGQHVLRLRVRGHAGEVNSCFQPVVVEPEPAGLSADEAADEAAAGGAAGGADGALAAKPEPISCFLDLPACCDGVAIDTVRGFLSLHGWAFGAAGIDRVEVFVDAVSQGRAHHGIRREDLQAAFPDQDAMLSGFAMVLPPAVMKPGLRSIRIAIHDRAGGRRDIALVARAERAALGPGPWMLRRKLPQAEIDLLAAIAATRRPVASWAIVLAASGTAAELATTLRSLAEQACQAWRATILAADPQAVRAGIPAELHDTILVVPPDPRRTLAELAGPADFVAVLTAGDRLGEDALLELGVAAALDPAADFLYSDERRIDPSDGTMKAFFKPDFSPDLLLSTNYVGRLWAATPALLRECDLREDELAGDYHAVLRLTERATRVRHVAKVLCERGGTAEPAIAEKRALRLAMQRRGISGRLRPGPVRGSHRVQRDIAVAAAKISIIIPTNGAGGLIRTAIGSIRRHTEWPDYEIICVDHIHADDQGDADRQGCKAWLATAADRVVAAEGPFNWSRFNNLAAATAQGAFLLFLNDDIEITDPLWLHGLVEHAQRPEIGVVGPQLRYPDGRVQHAGMFLGRHAARHAFRFYPHDEPGPFGLALTQREVIAVTGACLMVRRAVFDELGGFDEAHAVINNDLDFCLRAGAGVRRVVYTPAVSLIHHEAASRALLADTHDTARFSAAWAERFLAGDPYVSRHISPDHDDQSPDAEPVRSFVAGTPLIARDRVRRILAVKVDHIGDFVTAFPAFRRIKQRFEQAELVVLAAPASVALAGLEPAIDRILEFDFYHARSEKGRRAVGRRRLAALRLRLAAERFDLAIDLRRQPDTRAILPATGARWLAGFDSGFDHPWLDIAVAFEGDVALTRKREHVSDSLLGLVEAVSAQCESDRLVVRVAPTVARPAGEPAVVCVHTGAGALNKQWPAASFAGLIDLLVGEFDASIVLIGGADEAEFAQHVVSLARRRAAVRSLIGRTRLADLPDILRGADLYVGNDSGPKHLAASLGVPTIGIHSGSVDAGEWGAVGPHALTIRRDMSCSPCYLARASDCHRGLACLDGIRVADVAESCRRLLALRGAAQAG